MQKLSGIDRHLRWTSNLIELLSEFPILFFTSHLYVTSVLAITVMLLEGEELTESVTGIPFFRKYISGTGFVSLTSPNSKHDKVIFWPVWGFKTRSVIESAWLLSSLVSIDDTTKPSISASKNTFFGEPEQLNISLNKNRKEIPIISKYSILEKNT